MKQIIAIVEDDAQQRRYYADALRAQDYEIREYEDRRQEVEAFATELPDVDLINITLNAEGGAGEEVCSFIKYRDVSLPIILLNSLGDRFE